MKKSIILTCALLACAISHGQKSLNTFIVNQRETNEVHSSENREEFKAIFRCAGTHELTFKSNKDNLDEPEKKNYISVAHEQGENENIYTIIFPSKKSDYKNRKLSINSKGFNEVMLEKFNYDNHKVVDVYLDDGIVNNLFYINQAKGDSIMTVFDYQGARIFYSNCKLFPEYKEVENKRSIDRKIERIDSLLSWKDMGDRYLLNRRYKDAKQMYNKIIDEVPNDRVAMSKWEETNSKFQNDCEQYWNMAENFYSNKEYKRAKETYQVIVDMQCDNNLAAENQIKLCEDKIAAKSNHNRFFLWEFGLKDKNGDYPHTKLPLGITLGNCKPRRGGGYWTVRTNMDAFKMINKLNREKEHGLVTEANMSVGGTGHIFAPGGNKPGVWYHIGVGYTGNGIDLNTTSDEDSYTWKHAASPEVGLIFK